MIEDENRGIKMYCGYMKGYQRYSGVYVLLFS